MSDEQPQRVEPEPYLPFDLYNDLMGHLLSDLRVGQSLMLADRLRQATGQSALRRRICRCPDPDPSGSLAGGIEVCLRCGWKIAPKGGERS